MQTDTDIMASPADKILRQVRSPEGGPGCVPQTGQGIARVWSHASPFALCVCMQERLKKFTEMLDAAGVPQAENAGIDVQVRLTTHAPVCAEAQAALGPGPDRLGSGLCGHLHSAGCGLLRLPAPRALGKAVQPRTSAVSRVALSAHAAARPGPGADTLQKPVRAPRQGPMLPFMGPRPGAMLCGPRLSTYVPCLITCACLLPCFLQRVMRASGSKKDWYYFAYGWRSRDPNVVISKLLDKPKEAPAPKRIKR